MRDFRENQIVGNVTITDNSSEHKLLCQCSSEELISEERHRKALLSNERKRKNVRIFNVLSFCACVFIAAALWYWFKGRLDMVSVSLGFVSVVLTFFTLQGSEQRTEFELRQVHALNEISMLLRERGAR
ncbi:hypothetical protein ACPV52_15355 [Vibrio astriarenae]